MNPSSSLGSKLLPVLRLFIPLRKFILWLFVTLLFGVAAESGLAQTVELLNTDLNGATVGTYTNGAIINASGGSTTQLAVTIASPQVVQIAASGSNRFLQFIDNSAASANCYAKSTFSALSTSSQGNNFLSGSFKFTPLGPASGDPTFELLINAGSDLPGSSITAVQLDLKGGGNVSYKTGTTTANAPALTVGVAYIIAVYLDLSSSTQDTWGFSIARADTGVVVFSMQNLNTRAANIAPDRIVFHGGVNSTGIAAAPFAQIDDLNFSAAPFSVSLLKGPYYGDCLLKTSFARAALGSYSDGSVVNAGQLVQERIGVNVSSLSAVTVVSSSTSQAVQFTDNSTSLITSPMTKKYFAPLSTGAIGNNYITGSFEVTALSPSGGNPTFEYLINAGSDTAGGTVTAVQIDIRGSGAVTFKSGSTTVNGPTLTVGVKYLVSVQVDLSSSTQDTWRLEIARFDTGEIVFSADNLVTRAPNIAPDRVICNGGVNSTVANALPFIQLGGIQLYANHRPELAPLPLRMGSGDVVNGVTDSTTLAKFQTLNDLGAGMCRMGLYPSYYWNYTSKYGTINTPNTVTVENQMVMAHDNGITPILAFQYYGQYQSMFPLGDYNRWFQIGQAFATKFRPNSSWLAARGITNWGVTHFSAFNEPDTIGGTANTPPIPITGTVSYREALRGLADGVHSVDPTLKVFPGGFARPNSHGDWTCNGYAPAIADLFNDGHLDGIVHHVYFLSTSMGNYNASAQNNFNQVKATCGITRDVNFYCDEYNYVLNGDSQSNAAIYYLTALWDAVGVVGNSGQPVGQLAYPWNLFNTSVDDPNFGMATQLLPSWVPTPRGQVFQMVANLTRDMQIVSADPMNSGEYKLVGNNQTLWVWQNRPYWTNHASTTYTVQNLPLYATTLKVYNSTGLIQTIALADQMSCQVTDLTTGQTYMFVVDSQP